jgi:hypothetical protein
MAASLKWLVVNQHDATCDAANSVVDIARWIARNGANVSP